MSEDRIGWAVTVVVVVVLTVAILGGVLSYTWGMPNAVECVDEPTAERTPAMGVEVTANRARGYIMERNVLGCTVFIYQTRGDGDSYH